MKTAGDPSDANGQPLRAERASRRKARNNQAILDAAEQQFLKHGFHATTMESIAAAADMAVGSLYVYFANKDSLYLAVVERALAVLERALAEAFVLDLPPIKKLYAAGDAYIQFAFDHPAYFRMLIFPHTDTPGDAGATVMPPLVNARIDQLIQLITTLLEQSFHGSDAGRISPGRVARFLIGAWNGVIALHLRADDLRLERDEVKAVLDEAALILTEGMMSILDPAARHPKPA